MRTCKKHPCDVSNGVGVCATCLRERLFSLIAVQTAIDSQLLDNINNNNNSRRNTDDVTPTQMGPTNLTCSKSHRSGKFSNWSNKFFSKSRSDKSLPDPSPSSSWFSSVFLRRKKQSRLFTAAEEQPTAEYEENYNRSPLGSTPARRSRPGHAKSVSSLTFCLSPMVRPSPNRQWSQKADMANNTAEIRGSGKPNLGNAASYCGNRSRKFVDFGRANHNR
ncbi:hypothetical protein ACFE04_012666 [Oxalis oulophora]